MPEEKHNPPMEITQAEWDQAREGVPREMQAARLIVSRDIRGIPYTPYLRGDSDHAPVLRAVAGFAAKVYALLDALRDRGPMAQMPEEAEVLAAMKEFKL